jgi:hypothetical protein
MAVRHHVAHASLARLLLPYTRKHAAGRIWLGLDYNSKQPCDAWVVPPPALARSPPVAAIAAGGKKSGNPAWCRDDAPLFWEDGAQPGRSFLPRDTHAHPVWAHGVIAYADHRIERLDPGAVQLWRNQDGRWVSAMLDRHMPDAPPSEAELRARRKAHEARMKKKREESERMHERERPQAAAMRQWQQRAPIPPPQPSRPVHLIRAQVRELQEAKEEEEEEEERPRKRARIDGPNKYGSIDRYFGRQ